MATDAQTLMAEANCFSCYAATPYALQLMKLSLLSQLVTQGDPMADVTPQALMAQASCFNCYASNPYMLQLMELALLAQVVNGGGAGGGTDYIYWEDTGPTPSGPPPDQTKAWMINFRDGQPSKIWDPVELDWV